MLPALAALIPLVFAGDAGIYPIVPEMAVFGHVVVASPLRNAHETTCNLSMMYRDMDINASFALSVACRKGIVAMALPTQQQMDAIAPGFPWRGFPSASAAAQPQRLDDLMFNPFAAGPSLVVVQ